MREVTFTEFRKNASALFSSVEKGEVLHVTRHGKAIAEILPLDDMQKHVPSWKKPGLRLAVKGNAISRMILDERKTHQ